MELKEIIGCMKDLVEKEPARFTDFRVMEVDHPISEEVFSYTQDFIEVTEEEILFNLTYNGPVLPNKIIYEGKEYRIIRLDPLYIIPKFIVGLTEDYRLGSIHIVDSIHPNAGYKNDLKFEKSNFCINPFYIGKPFKWKQNPNGLIDVNLLKSIMTIWNLDHPRWRPSKKDFETTPRFPSYY